MTLFYFQCKEAIAILYIEKYYDLIHISLSFHFHPSNPTCSTWPTLLILWSLDIMHKNLWNIFYLLNFHTTLYLPLLRPSHLFYLLACKWDGRKRRKGGSKFMEAFLNKSLAHKCSFQDLPLRRRLKAAFHGGQWWLQV